MYTRHLLYLCILWICTDKTHPAGETIEKVNACFGTWEVIRVEVSGRPTRAASTKVGDIMRFTRNEMLRVDRFTKAVGLRLSITYDGTITPVEIAITGVNVHLVGIIEADGDKMRICYGIRGVPPPHEFNTREHDGLSLIVLRRMKE